MATNYRYAIWETIIQNDIIGLLNLFFVLYPSIFYLLYLYTVVVIYNM